ncbi:MAG: hypothetical protein Q4F00_01030 [bacterium]|nr:hypothetical protein [bacterium]
MKTALGTSIDIAVGETSYDSNCKRLLSQKSVLAWIMKDCVGVFNDFAVDAIAGQCIENDPLISEVPLAPDVTGAFLQGQINAQTSPTEGDVYFDIYFNAVVPRTHDSLHLIINVEAQADFYPGYPILKRGVYYCARMLSSQKETIFTQSHYEQLRKVYSIWLCTNPPKDRRNTIISYQMTPKSIRGYYQEDVGNYDLLTVVVVCLGDENSADCTGILKLLTVLLSRAMSPQEKKQILQDEFSLPMTQAMEKEVDEMCNLGHAIYVNGVDEGRKEGRKEGREEGRISGVAASIKSLMESMGWEINEAMNALRIPEADRQTYINALAQQ